MLKDLSIALSKLCFAVFLVKNAVLFSTAPNSQIWNAAIQLTIFKIYLWASLLRLKKKTHQKPTSED